MIRKAVLDDTQKIAELINYFAEQKKMLPREAENIAENIRDFLVAEEEGKVVGCVALHFYSRDLAEIRSLAVKDQAQGKGYGKMLIKQSVKEHQELGGKRIFALTYVDDLFKGLGFMAGNKEELPEKIWAECSKCEKFHDCDEICIIYNIGN
jgi:amino-acid N-acetyltransferase